MKKSVKITEDEIDITEALGSVQDDTAGGTVVFIGTIRNNNEGRKVTGLEYEVYDKMAERTMQSVEIEIKKRWPVKKVIMVHRKGRLKVGEVSVVVAVSSEHRAEAFEACKFGIDMIKRRVPIWKNEKGAANTSKWAKGRRISGWQETR